uniref:PIN domain-containing protein n=1 Tax=Ditylum brightwellii TaxID=49249 RepID=A0A6V2J445_9STRA|mmetsp:Transcript_12028/g.16060  ORF Transcript_12028/g.16060 Transcript_12028/m.16060 type:complete len:171 (+) Transcript_12028:170-682(+)
MSLFSCLNQTHMHACNLFFFLHNNSYFYVFFHFFDSCLFLYGIFYKNLLFPQNRNKLDVVRSMMDCLLAKCIPCITDCVMGELEKLGHKYRVALRLAKDERFERIPCQCKGCYADDCLVNMAKQWRCFIVATCDKELRGRIRKIPGVPCMYISSHKYTVERMPEAFGAPR